MVLGRRPAFFFDRDGVLVDDPGATIHTRRLELLPGALEAIRLARAAGRLVFVVTNQTIVARGVATEDDVRNVHADLGLRLAREGGAVDAFYFCPHHPSATLVAYRTQCDCRKPRPGMLLEAAREWDVDLAGSVMVGDRLSDVAAGKRAGCRAGLVMTGQHDAPPIESPDAFMAVEPDFITHDVLSAVRHALGGAP
jgi:D-glycero-D-manno-heptose 1,7-bisphosphate phosphatase